MSAGYYDIAVQKDKNEWLHTRQLGYWIVRGWADPKTAPKTPDDLMSLEPAKKVKKIPAKKLKELADKINAQLNSK